MNRSNIALPKWKQFAREHPVDQYNIVTKNCSGKWRQDEIIDIRHHYYAMIAEVDEMIGEVVQAIPSDQRDNTVIVFTSDHGDLAMGKFVLNENTKRK